MRKEAVNEKSLNGFIDEVNFFDLLKLIWLDKIRIAIVFILFSLISVFYAYSKPNYYESSVVLYPSNGNKGNELNILSSQLGGIANLAGLNIKNSEVKNQALAEATLRSRIFLDHFVNKFNLKVPLMAFKEWDFEGEKLIIDENIYSIESKNWVRNQSKFSSVEPTKWEVYNEISARIKLSKDKKTGLIVLSVTHPSPVFAKKWSEDLVSELNLWMKTKSINETKRNIKYLSEQLEKTELSNMKIVFFQLIEEQTKNLMLAEVEEEFIFKVIDPPVLAEEKSGPNRVVYLMLGSFLGLLFGCLYTVVRIVAKHSYYI
ncbi:Wzz/FepE/Etk N-terminal domain-containing protein [Vibrio nigripulchritudo]|uniref:Wzz/FepE/Etk N-terminal domain-containing protein n=1 Tax=Vibrio nigripulchritudo TaxID=28173 RepID=UPI0005F9B64B|nr:Wzz/FepE/Etk N-terminal domain-containing protein [Vibrio nigripulchritudo]KJY79072.1 hypothetical protein TW74_10300 [Vibrio nigripulchritudo]